MKNKAAKILLSAGVACGLLLPGVSCGGQAVPEGGPSAKEDRIAITKILDEACVHPCRSIGTNAVDLGPLFSFARRAVTNGEKLALQPPKSHWVLLYGKVSQIESSGFLFENFAMSDLSMAGKPTLIHVKNHPAATYVVAGVRLHFWALPVGRFSCQDTPESAETIPEYDFGQACSSEQLASLATQSDSRLPETWKPRVRAALDLAGEYLRVRNISREDWPELSLLLVGVDGTEFTNSIPALSGGAVTEVPLTNFVDQAGSRAKAGGQFKKAAIGGNGFQFGAYRL